MTFNEFISPIFPGWALRRERSRAQFEALHSRKFDGASKGRRTQDWRTSGNINSDIGGALSTLRLRSRDLYQNSEYGRRAMQAIRNNTVGTGIRLAVEGLEKNPARDLLRKWRRWSESTEADFYKQQDFHALQTLVMQTVAISGDALIIKRKGTNASGLPFSIQVLDGEHLDVTRNGTFSVSKTATESGDIIRYGVQFDSQRRVTGYWIYDQLPSETYQVKKPDSQFYPVEDVCHIYLIEYAGQIRGIPWLTAGMIGLKDMDQFEEAQLIRQKIAACFSVFVHDFTGDPSEALAGETPDSERVEPGIIQYLPQGKTISFAQPPATEGYESYMTQRLRRFAASIGLSYEVVSADYSRVNFSSGRMGWIEMSRNISEWQNRIVIPMMCEKVFSWWKNAAMIQGIITQSQAKNSWSSWTTPRREMLDPVKETKAMAEQIKNGLISWQEALRSLGYDPEDISAEAAEAIEILSSLGVKFDWMISDDNQDSSTEMEDVEERLADLEDLSGRVNP